MLVIVLATLGALLALPTLASANTTFNYSTSLHRLQLATDGGESNFISASQNGNTYSFSDDGFNDTTFNSIDLTLGTNAPGLCTKFTTPTVRVDCTIPGLSYIEVNLGSGEFDGYDASDLSSATPHPVSITQNIDGGLGDDYILGGTGNDTMLGSTGDDDLEGDLGNDTIDAGDDDDSYLDGGPGNDTIDGGNGADYMAGSEGNDTLHGGIGDDSIEGDDGDDTYLAESAADGADTFDDYGDGGTDTMDYSARGAAGLAIDNDDDFDDGAVALSAEDGIGNLDEIASDIEVLIGGAGADTLAGVGQLANGGPNVLRGNGGDDNLVGTDGTVPDVADYSNSSVAITANLATGTATGAGTDSLNAIEGVYGGSAADSLTGSTADNLLRGNGANDTLSGGSGNDTADYANSTGAVTMNLAAANPHNTGAAGSDTLTSMESATGGSNNDNLTGDSGPNTLTGNGGNDMLTGGAGHDAVSGGDGTDNLQVRDTEDDGPLTCGAGTDSVTADGLPRGRDRPRLRVGRPQRRSAARGADA